jgi:hypothetical protein
MNKRFFVVLLAVAAVLLFAGCGGGREQSAAEAPAGSAPQETPAAAPEDPAGDAGFRIGIVTGSYSQSEDDRRGAEAFQKKYGADMVTLAIYPDNFAEDPETTVQIMVNLAEDPRIKAIVVNQAVDGTAEAFRQIHEKRPDVLCIAGEAYEDFSDIGAAADLVVNCDYINRGYLMIRTAHMLGCDTFLHISFPRHLSYETVARRVAVMRAACDEFGLRFATETAPDPTTEVGVPGAQSYILEHVPEWLDKYGKNTAFFCTNDAHTEPLIKALMENGGYFIEADLPSPLMGYPGALDLDLTGEAGDFEKILKKVETAVVENGGAGRFGTWSCSYGYSVSAGLAEHARSVLAGESELTGMADMFRAFAVFSPGVEWNGSHYADAETGERLDNTLLVYQDTYIMGDPGYFAGSTRVVVPEKYFTVK